MRAGAEVAAAVAAAKEDRDERWALRELVREADVFLLEVEEFNALGPGRAPYARWLERLDSLWARSGARRPNDLPSITTRQQLVDHVLDALMVRLLRMSTLRSGLDHLRELTPDDVEQARAATVAGAREVLFGG